MLQRIGLWGFCGLAIALMWAAVFYALGPGVSKYPSQGTVLHYLGHTVLLPITAPVALLGRHYPMTWYWSAVFNAGIYACIGSVVETVRIAVRWSSVRLTH